MWGDGHGRDGLDRLAADIISRHADRDGTTKSPLIAATECR
jgi:hypothetical protein